LIKITLKVILMRYANSVKELIGNTPLVKIDTQDNLLLAKCEFMNPNGSVKDRVALQMIEDALNNKTIDKDTTLIEPTSGNTGVGLASVCASMGLKLILTMPESMSDERKKLLKALGANLVLTEAKEGMNGAIAKAKELANTLDNAHILGQFDNPSNPKAHKHSTALEILKDTNGNIDIFVASVGTGGTLMGIASVLKAYDPNIKIVAVEPKNSAVLSGECANVHKIQGIGAGFIPSIVDTKMIDEIIKVDENDAIKEAREMARRDGLLVGISSGANIYASKLLANQPNIKNKTIITILCDTGERYLSTELYQD
jgi:cysteine synthase A